MKRKHLFSTVVIAFAFAVICHPIIAQEAELKSKWIPGKRYVQQMEMHMAQDVTMPNAPAPTKQEMNQTQEYAITVSNAAPDGSKTLEMEFTSMKLDMKIGDQTTSFDSKGKPEENAKNPMGQMMGKFIGAKIKFTVDTNNKVTNVDLKDFTTAFGSSEMLETMGYGESTFKQMIEQSANQLPNKTVKVGEQWKTSLSMPLSSFGVMDMKMDSTFKGMEDRDAHQCAVIPFTGTMSIMPGEAKNPMGMKITMKDSKISGQTWFDPSLGTIVESKMNQKADMDMEVTLPDAKESMKMASKLSNDVTTKLVRMEDVK